MPNKKGKIILGGIIKHSNGGYGFKISCEDPETANKYKDEIRWSIIGDGHPLDYKLGYHDDYKEDGYKRKEL